MRNTLLGIAVAALVATAFSFAAARWLASRPDTEPPLPTFHDIAWLDKELQLTSSQLAELEQHAAGFSKSFNALCAKHCDARMELGNELAKAAPDVERCRRWVDEMNEAQAEAERETLGHILMVRSVLTEEQAERYGQLVREQVCSMIPEGTR